MTALLSRWLPRRAVHTDAWERWLAADNAEPPGVPAGRLHVVQYIGALYCGGAERQLCNLSLGLQDQGHRCTVRTTYPLDGDLGHYCGLLARGGIQARPARVPRRRPWRRLDRVRLNDTPPAIRDYIYRLAVELADDRPDVLHCWLDLANVVGGLAGLLAGVPRIILGLRTSNPTHFPRFDHDFLLPGYRRLLRSRRVELLANSRSAADSYADWLGLPRGRIPVVRNGLALRQFPPADPAASRGARLAFGLRPEQRVVCGVFRFFEEKQPELFLRVVRRAAERVANLKVLIAGIGPLEGRMRAYVSAHHMDYIGLLGRREDVAQLLRAADVLLLTSAQDSSPNAVLEAQCLGLPVVATDVGGIPEIVRHGETGLLAGPHDEDALAGHLVRLLTDDSLRRSYAAAAVAARESFSLDRMIARTLAVYRDIGGASTITGWTSSRNPMKPI